MNWPTVLDRLRTPAPTDVVEVSLTGHPVAVTDLARAIATVAVVTSMRHRPGGEASIRLDVTCHRLARLRRGGGVDG